MACGQYGDETERPHYHLCAFNLAFTDERRYSETQHTSALLDDTWGLGVAKLAPFLGARAGYVAGYATKHGRREYYDSDGILHPPFFRASKRPALGKDWLKKFADDVHHGYVILDGVKHPVPRYYKKWLPIMSRTWDEHRSLTPHRWTEDMTELRRLAAEKIHQQYHARRRRDIR